MINIVLLGICFIVFVMLVVTVSRRLDLCCTRLHPAFDLDEEAAVPDETSDEGEKQWANPLKTVRYSG